MLLLDCVAGQLIELAGRGVIPTLAVVSAAGPYVAYHDITHIDITVVRLDSDGSDGTIVQPVTHVTLSMMHDQFELCEGGHSYLLFDYRSKTLHLVDLLTRNRKRVFTPRT